MNSKRHYTTKKARKIKNYKDVSDLISDKVGQRNKLKEKDQIFDKDDACLNTSHSKKKESRGLEANSSCSDNKNKSSTFLSRNNNNLSFKYIPGIFILDPKNWNPEFHNYLVVYSLNKNGSRVHRLGLLRNPIGKRSWIILDSEIGEEYKVNKYNISFHWPKEDPNPPKTLEEAYEILKETNNVLNDLFANRDPYTIWAYFYECHHKDRGNFAEVNPSIEKHDFKKIYKDSSLLHEKLEDHDLFDQITERVKESYEKFPKKVAPRIIKENNEKIIYICLEEAVKLLLKYPETRQITPFDILIAHLYFIHFPDYFPLSIYKGFYCNDMESVVYKKVEEEYNKIQSKLYSSFVEKLKCRLEQVRMIAKLENLDSNFSKETKDPVPQVHNSSPPERLDKSDLKLLQDLKRYALKKDVTFTDYTIADKILIPLGFGEKPQDAFDLLVALDLLSKYENPHILRWDKPLGFSQYYEDLAYKEVAKAMVDPKADPDYETRVDMRNTVAFIFPERVSQGMEYAISLHRDEENRDWVLIHVVDVESYVGVGSELDLKGREFASTISIPDEKFPIFPKALFEFLELKSERAKSRFSVEEFLMKTEKSEWEIKFDEILKQVSQNKEKDMNIGNDSCAKDRDNSDSNIDESNNNNNKHTYRCLSFAALLYPTGELENWHILNTLIQNIVEVSINEVDIILEKTKLSNKVSLPGKGFNELKLPPRLAEIKKNYIHTIKVLMDLASRRRATRLGKRAIIPATVNPDVKIVKDPFGKSIVHVGALVNWGYNAYGLLMEFSILAGELAAIFLAKNRVPGIFYTQSVNEKRRNEFSLTDLIDQNSVIQNFPKVSGPAIVKRLNLSNILGPIEYTTVPSPNDALGVSMYMSITNPLSNYFNLVAQQQIKSILRDLSKPAFTSHQFLEFIPEVLEKIEQNKIFAESATRFWILGCFQEIFKKRPSKIYEGVVVQSRTEHDNEYKVLLSDFGILVTVSSPVPIRRGHVVKMKVQLVNPFYDTLILKIEN